MLSIVIFIQMVMNFRFFYIVALSSIVLYDIAVHVVRERVSKQSLGSAFVWFDNEESVRLAVNELNGKVAFLAIMVTLISWFPPPSHIHHYRIV